VNDEQYHRGRLMEQMASGRRAGDNRQIGDWIERELRASTLTPVILWPIISVFGCWVFFQFAGVERLFPLFAMMAGGGGLLYGFRHREKQQTRRESLLRMQGAFEEVEKLPPRG
jgi:hypothetical protein